MHVYGMWKDGTDEPICRAAMEIHMKENRLVEAVGEEEGGTN